MDTTIVEVERKDNLSIISFNNAPHNLLNSKFLDSIEASINQCLEKDARALLFVSRLKHFSAGADPTAFDQNNPETEMRDTMRLVKIFESAPVPTVAAINGAALGGGFELALGCDFIIASETARMGLVEVSVGLMPLSGGVQRIIYRAGEARGKEMAMLGRRYDAKTLESWGVVNLVVPEVELFNAAVALALQLSNGPTVALKEIKRIGRIASREGVESADKAMSVSVKKILGSTDASNGVSFLADNSEPIVFKGE